MEELKICLVCDHTIDEHSLGQGGCFALENSMPVWLAKQNPHIYKCECETFISRVKDLNLPEEDNNGSVYDV